MRNLKIALVIAGGLFFIYLLSNGYIIRRSREYDEQSDHQEPLNSHQGLLNNHQNDHQESQNDHKEPQDDHQESYIDHQKPLNSHQIHLNSHQVHLNNHQNDYQETQNDHQQPQNGHQEPQIDHQEPLYNHQVHLNNHQNDHQESQNILPPNGTLRGFRELRGSDFEQLKTFVFFLGHQRSGHSIVGSILDAHPHVILAHEAKLFLRLSDNLSHNLSARKTPWFNNTLDIFNFLWKKSFQSSTSGLRTEGKKALLKGYTLAIDGLYQGTFVPPIQVIGDKNGGQTTLMFVNDPKNWNKLFLKLQSFLNNIPIKVIHVIRNPYDNIATKALYKSATIRRVTNVKYKNKSHEVDVSLLKRCMNEYFEMSQAIQQIKHKYDLNYLEVHGKDLIANPKSNIVRMCNFLGISCFDNYLDICSSKLFKTESKTRYKVTWTKELISDVQDSIMNFDNLKRYSFDS